VVDPALQLSEPRAVPRPDRASAPQEGPALRILLAHNPALARLGAQAGFDLQLSGHTHAGQFFPWTLAVRMVHAPHVAGLSRLGKMWVYVNAGTGSWGPPVRFGTRTELTLIRLARG
jgi:predicted MPP superfamily phosphohydrolase